MVKKLTPKPETEQKLYDLQEKYLENRDVTTYQEMFSLLYPYARSLILKKTTGKIYLSKDIVDNATMESCVKFMEGYLRPDFKIESSFAGLLNLKVLEALYSPKQRRSESMVSLNAIISTSADSDMELHELSDKLNFVPLFRPDAANDTLDPVEYLFNKDEDAIKSVMTVFDNLYASLGLKDYLIVSLGILHFLRKNKNYDKYRSYYMNNSNRKVLDLSLLEIRDRLANVA